MSKINNRTERKEDLLYILEGVFIFLVILFIPAYFFAHYSVIILSFLGGHFNFITTMDLYYIIHTIVMSFITFTLFIRLLTKGFRKKKFKVIDITTGKDITKNVEIQVWTDNKDSETI